MSGLVLEFETLKAAYLESLRLRSYSERTLVKYSDALGIFMDYVDGLGVDGIKSITIENIDGYHLWMKDERGFAGSSVWQYLQVVRQFFDYLESVDEIFISPALNLVMPKCPRSLPRLILTSEEVKAILSVPDTATGRGLRDRAILEVLYSCGIRLDEMASLQVFDVDCHQGLLQVAKGKGGKGRVVPLGKVASQWLQNYLKDARSHWSKKNRDDQSMWLRGQSPYTGLNKWYLGNRVRYYGKAALNKNVSPHIWRHTCATHLIRGGADVTYVQRILGHESLETTQIYTQVAAMEVQGAHRKKHPRARSRICLAPSSKNVTVSRRLKRASKQKATR